MPSIEQLLQDRAALIADARKIVDAADAEKREVTPDEQNQIDEKLRKAEGLKTQADQRAELEAAEESTRKVLDAEPDLDGDEGGTRGGDPTVDALRQEHMRAFHEFFCTGVRENYDRATAKLRAAEDALNTGSGTGGYIVPQLYFNMLMEARDATVKIRPRVRVATSKNDVKLPKMTARGAASWGIELPTSEYSATHDTYNEVSFDAYRCTRLEVVSRDLLEDSMFNIEQLVFRSLGIAIGKAEDNAFTAGDGSGKPTGIVESATAAVTAASATAVTGDEVKQLARTGMDEEYLVDSECFWLMRAASSLAVETLKDGQGQYIWRAGLEGGKPDMLCGFPVVTTSYAPAMTAGLKALTLVNGQCYMIVDRPVFTFQRLNEIKALQNCVGFLGSRRTDGHLIDDNGAASIQMAGS